ncbi:MAG: phosphoribosylformylglycinamidine synthase subunit PurL, partial [Candidatus Electryoneaceae bacterium]|nr:phosphoribosylformylglycinamidine synthase subunit PurL [Candidatus Electryoneaceae bacterium]
MPSQPTKHDPNRPGTLEEAKSQTLTEEEFHWIREILGRTPNVTELSIFAAMWSEHCSYKNSILELKTLPRSGGRLLVEAGEENAGLVDIGDGWAVAFKIESHNHPSAVEPFQGAATGVGGILRDIFTMGARPLAALNSLRFANLDDAHTRFLLDGIVRGIGDYGNCFGVPTVAGEVCFDPSYRGNPLVNAMAVGVVRADSVTYAKATGVGNPVFYVGSRTGRDGIHGVTFASEELSEDNEAKRPAVQVGDPFAEKLLLEATLELAQTDALVGIQDMGGAGLSCCISEMAAAGGVGMDIDLDKVPLRETDIEPWEIMLSESQERMLLIAQAGKEEVIKEIFERWELEVVEIGCVTDDGILRIRHQGQLVAEVPAWNLVLGGGAPQYRRESHRPEELDQLASFDPLSLPEPDDPGMVLLKILADPDVASKEWIWTQYDQSVRTNTAIEPGRGDAAVIRVEGTNKGLAVCTDGNGRYVRLDPRLGASLNVAEAARNVACVGARPVAITNCLNFGHPYKPEIYYFFREAVAGMGEACRAFNTPVTGGNVSFYNETNGTAVLPTPVIGMLGVFDDVSKYVGATFQQEEDVVYLLGEATGSGLGGSCYLRAIFKMTAGRLTPMDYDGEKRLIDLLIELVEKRITHSAHDVSDGGLAVCLTECCILNKE